MGLKVGVVMERTKCGAEGWRRNGKPSGGAEGWRRNGRNIGEVEGWRRNGKNKVWGGRLAT